jgi:hypothetical protein
MSAETRRRLDRVEAIDAALSRYARAIEREDPTAERAAAEEFYEICGNLEPGTLEGRRADVLREYRARQAFAEVRKLAAEERKDRRWRPLRRNRGPAAVAGR